ncbi:MAG: hypothetical protein R3195_09725 [Gemmatimonadota bacterium]|nr:hypothetical protein [Gemmatimonadota bacterium]
MTDREPKPRLPPTALVSTAVVAAGVLLWMFVSRGWLVVAGLGAFGPGILRELGLLSDHDEFQRRAARRAGYHAYLIGGFAAIAVLSAIEWGGGAVDESAEWIRFIVVVLWLTWLSSTLLTFWGPQKTAARVLTAFGAFWAVFVVATLIGDAVSMGPDPELLLGVAVGIGLLTPFFGLAWTARRWPHATGLCLLAASAIIFLVFGMRRANFEWSAVVMRDTLLLGPLLVSGLALLFGWGAEETTPEENRRAAGRSRSRDQVLR